jgi:high affinity sulfate transporter 1
MKNSSGKSPIHQLIPILQWLPHYNGSWLKWDLIAGVTLASFVLPESMAYATLAGLPPHYGIYCVLVGGFFFAMFTSSKHVAVGPTSSISLMVGSTVAILSGGDPQKWIAIAGLAALVVAILCVIAYVLKLSSLVNFISDSILLGFKAGAALSIMATQLPKLFGLEGGGHNFFSRVGHLIPQLPEMHWPVFLFGMAAMIILIAGDHFFPGKPVSLGVVIASILLMSFSGLVAMGFQITGEIPSGLPSLGRPSIKLSDVNGVIELAFACFLMGYIETVSAARTMALKNNYTVDPRQELLSLGAANLTTGLFSGYIVAGGLSQSTVNEKSGAKTPLSLAICSISLAVILLFFTNLLTNLPEVILAVIVLHAVMGLIKIKELKRIFQLSKMEFAIAMIALVGVLVFGILKGVIISVILSLIFLIRKASNPNVAILGRIGKSPSFSDIERHPSNVQISGLLILRVESSILYFNSDNIFQKILSISDQYPEGIKLLVLDLSSSPYVDVSGTKMLLQLVEHFSKKGVQCKIVEALSGVRDILRKQGMEELIGPISRVENLADIALEFERESGGEKK